MKVGKFILKEWQQDLLGNWYRQIDYNLPKPPVGMDYKADIFVEVWNNPRSDGSIIVPWFKYTWIENLFAQKFRNYEDIELTKINVDTFLKRLDVIIAFS